jgi:hypothetical protein
LVKVGVAHGVRLVAGVLILREDVAPEFLVLFHELKDRLSIPLLFVEQIDEDDLLSLEWVTSMLVSLSLAIQLVVLAVSSVFNAELFLSPFDLNSQALLTFR